MGEFSEQLRQRVLDWLANHVPQSRIEHVLRVEQMAMELARLHQLDQSRAAQAGLMHDLAKYFKPQILLEMAQRANLPIDPVDQLNPHLLHATVSALVAHSEFDIQDGQVLDAIANHTLGSPEMAPLSCVVFLADSLEPGRGDKAELEQLRQISQTDLIKAVWLTSDYSLRQLLDQGRLIHPRALATRNWFLHHSHTRVVRQPNRQVNQQPDWQLNRQVNQQLDPASSEQTNHPAQFSPEPIDRLAAGGDGLPRGQPLPFQR
jgi:predicted HD superfamily hydrolase involved in NAD metabolism